MRYWLDTEFIEDGKTIDLISIGVVAEDGRELYLQNMECRFKKANDWVRVNVLPQLRAFRWRKLKPIIEADFLPSRVWATRREIARQLLRFCDIDQHGTPEFWGYFADYDWVAVCQLYGTMMDLPHEWPMYCRDLKQLCDHLGKHDLPQQESTEHNALADARWNRDVYAYLTGSDDPAKDPKPATEPSRSGEA